MRNFVIELSLGPHADVPFLFQHVSGIQSDALCVEGVVATRGISSSNSWPDRLVLNVLAESGDRALGFSAFARMWGGVTSIRVSEVINLDKPNEHSLPDSNSPLLPSAPAE